MGKIWYINYNREYSFYNCRIEFINSFVYWEIDLKNRIEHFMKAEDRGNYGQYSR